MADDQDAELARRLALSLRALEGMECGVPVGTVLSWIHRGRVLLKKRWQAQGDERCPMAPPGDNKGERNALR
ncbi:MAG: hypothetical protein NZT92_07895 [Abditibacteriales bacterium]|nr:hypothetical protein [Abditibacteriales bacterium]MDW8364719.1 hypothetical protein [Abditibacteriales bacterium]